MTPLNQNFRKPVPRVVTERLKKLKIAALVLLTKY